jgi:hypothetical protein
VIVVYTGTYLGCIALAVLGVQDLESHTNPTDNSNLQGNVDENKEYEHKFLGQERAATNTQRAKRKSL